MLVARYIAEDEKAEYTYLDRDRLCAFAMAKSVFRNFVKHYNLLTPADEQRLILFIQKVSHLMRKNLSNSLLESNTAEVSNRKEIGSENKVTVDLDSWDAFVRSRIERVIKRLRGECNERRIRLHRAEIVREIG